MGLFNAATAVASVTAALAAGAVAQWLNYGATCWTAAGATIIGLIFFLPVLRKSPSAHDTQKHGCSPRTPQTQSST
jgi:predicted MFS family arabinose efflux permease